MLKISSEQALVELTKGNEIEWLSDNNEWLPMNVVVNPISEPNKAWRVKLEPWEESYNLYIQGSDFPDDSQSEEAYEAGWNAAMELNKPKKP